MAAAIKQAFKCAVELTPGGGGVFEVAVDGQTIFSKKQSVRFPKEADIVKAINGLRRQGAPPA